MTALDDLAAYLGDPDRPYDARALELVAQALDDRNARIPRAGSMDANLDLPFQESAPGTGVSLADTVICGGWTVGAFTAPVPDGPDRVMHLPGLLFRFSRYDGTLVRPLALILTDEQMGKIASLVADAAGAARRAAAA